MNWTATGVISAIVIALAGAIYNQIYSSATRNNHIHSLQERMDEFYGKLENLALKEDLKEIKIKVDELEKSVSYMKGKMNGN